MESESYRYRLKGSCTDQMSGRAARRAEKVHVQQDVEEVKGKEKQIASQKLKTKERQGGNNVRSRHRREGTESRRWTRYKENS